MYDTTLNTRQQQDIEGYLAWKWGLQSNLPAYHPYKNQNVYDPSPITVKGASGGGGATGILLPNGETLIAGGGGGGGTEGQWGGGGGGLDAGQRSICADSMNSFGFSPFEYPSVVPGAGGGATYSISNVVVGLGENLQVSLDQGATWSNVRFADHGFASPTVSSFGLTYNGTQFITYSAEASYSNVKFSYDGVTWATSKAIFPTTSPLYSTTCIATSVSTTVAFHYGQSVESTIMFYMTSNIHYWSSCSFMYSQSTLGFQPFSVAAGQSNWILTGYTPTTDNRYSIFQSLDGRQWYQQDFGVGFSNPVGCMFYDGYFYAGESGYPLSNSLKSLDGITWVSGDISLSNPWDPLVTKGVYENGQWLIQNSYIPSVKNIVFPGVNVSSYVVGTDSGVFLTGDSFSTFVATNFSGLVNSLVANSFSTTLTFGEMNGSGSIDSMHLSLPGGGGGGGWTVGRGGRRVAEGGGGGSSKWWTSAGFYPSFTYSKPAFGRYPGSVEFDTFHSTLGTGFGGTDIQSGSNGLIILTFQTTDFTNLSYIHSVSCPAVIENIHVDDLEIVAGNNPLFTNSTSMVHAYESTLVLNATMYINGVNNTVGINVSEISTATLDVNGVVLKTAGSFVIRHPDSEKSKEGYKLRHSFVESPTRGDTLYSWTVSTLHSTCILDLPDYFKYLNENAQVWVTALDSFAIGRGRIENNTLVLDTTEDGLFTVLCVATRKDSNAKYFDYTGVEYRGVPWSTELSSTSRYNINHTFIIIQIGRVYVL